VNIRITFIF